MRTLNLGLCLTLIVLITGCAAQRHLKQGNAAVLADHHAEAVRQFEAALSAKPSLSRDPVFTAKLNRARAEALYERGMELQRTHAYDSAANAFRAATASDATFTPPAAALERLGPTAAQWYTSQADTLKARGDLDSAINHLQKAVAYDTNNTAASSQLSSTIELRRARRAEADNKLAQATEAAQRGQWKEALRHVEAASALLPMDQTIKSRINQVRADATNAYLAQAAGLMADEQFSAADDALVEAAIYSGDDVRVKEALASVDAGRGEAAARHGMHGMSYIWFSQAEAHHPGTADKQLASARRTVLAQHAFPIQIESDDAALAGEVREQIARKAPDLFAIGSDGTRVQLAITALAIDQKHIDTNTRTHMHTIHEVVPNPRLGVLQYELEAARREVHHLNRQFAITCSHCDGRGYGHHRETRKRFNCTYCNHTGRLHYRITRHQIQQAQWRADRLHRELLSEPATITRPVPAAWEYQVQTFRKSGSMGVKLTIADRTATTITRSYDITDTTFDNANPAIGLPANPLELPTDKQVRDILTRGAASEAATHTINALGGQLLADLDRRAKAAKGDEAVELRIAADIVRAMVK